MSDQRPEEWWPFRGPVPEPPPGPDVVPTQELPAYSPWARPTPTSDPTLHLPSQDQGSPLHAATPSRPRPQWPAPGPAAQQWRPPVAPAPTQQFGVPPSWQPPPHAWAAQPAPRPGRHRGRSAAVLTLCLVVGIVAGFLLHGAFQEPGVQVVAPPTSPTVTSRSTTATTTTRTATPTPSPSISPAFTPYQVPPTKWAALPQPSPTTRAERIVQTNRLYDVQIPAPPTCPSIPDDLSLNSQFRKLSQQLVECHYRAWLPVFQSLGMEFVRPTLVTFRDTVTSRCGTVSEDQSFYCPASAEIYLSEQRFESSRDWWRLHFANTISHEFLHHVQSSAGILEAAYALDLDSDERVRRVELQAYCLTSRLMVVTPAYEFDDEDYRILRDWTTEGGSDTHGSAESRQYWWMRGLEQPTPAGCNTWVVDSDQVT